MVLKCGHEVIWLIWQNKTSIYSYKGLYTGYMKENVRHVQIQQTLFTQRPASNEFSLLVSLKVCKGVQEGMMMIGSCFIGSDLCYHREIKMFLLERRFLFTQPSHHISIIFLWRLKNVSFARGHNSGYLNPVYDSDGNIVRIIHTVHDGRTFLLPMPSRPHIHRVNWR